MANRWVVDEDYPEGHLVPMTEDELHQLEHDRATASAHADVEHEAEVAAAARVEDLRRARIELATGRIFQSFTTSERAVLDMLLAESTPSI